MKSKKNAIIVALALLVLSLSGYMLYDTMNGGMSQAEINMQFNDLKADYEFIQKDLETKVKELSASNSLLAKQKVEIENIFKKTSITEEELVHAKKLMRDISQTVIDEYKKRIAELEQQKQGIESEKVNVETQKQEGDKEIADLRKKINVLENENSVVTVKYKKEKAQSDQKDDLLAYASRLKISNFQLKGFKVRGNGKEVATEKASKVDRIKVSFDLDENKLAKDGSKELYIILFQPDGKQMTMPNKPTGTFSSDGKPLTYSDKVSFDYVNGQDKTIETVWDSEDFVKGDYIMEVYEKDSDGNVHRIGKATKTLQ